MSVSSITGIGNLGFYGLGGAGSYFDPYSMMGANAYSMAGYSPYAMGGMGMMGMYPAFMSQMNQIQQDIEKNQLSHSSAMHNLLNQNRVEAFQSEDRAFFEKAMIDTGVNKGIINLAEKVREGDTDGVCQMYDELKQTIYAKYSDYFKKNKNINPNDYVTNFIEILYNKTLKAQGYPDADLRSDIKKFGQSAFTHGFWKNLHGQNYPNKYSEETLAYVFGTPVMNKTGKERMEKLGANTEKVVEGLAAMGVGAVAVPTTLTICKSFLGAFVPEKLAEKCANNKFLSKIGFMNKKVATLGAIAALGADIMWQMSR